MLIGVGAVTGSGSTAIGLGRVGESSPAVRDAARIDTPTGARIRGRGPGAAGEPAAVVAGGRCGRGGAPARCRADTADAGHTARTAPPGGPARRRGVLRPGVLRSGDRG